MQEPIVLDVDITLGGPGSGNFGHVGRPGVRGGSSSKDDVAGGVISKHDKAMTATNKLRADHTKDDHDDIADMIDYRSDMQDHIERKNLAAMPDTLDNVGTIHDSLAAGHYAKEDAFRASGDYTKANAHGAAASMHEDAAVEANKLASSIRNKLTVALPPPAPSKRGVWSNTPLDRKSYPSVQYDYARKPFAPKPSNVSDQRWAAMQKQIKNRGGKRDKTFEEHHEFESYEDRRPNTYPVPSRFPAHVLSLMIPIELPM